MKPVPRTSLSDRIRNLGGPKHQAFAKFIRQGDEGGPVPCWGGILERLEQDFPADHDRDDLLDALIAEGDSRPLYLFLHSARSRPAVLRMLLQRAADLPVQVQRYLVSLPEAAQFVSDALDGLDPAARQVWEAGDTVHRVEREVFKAKVGELQQFKWFSPRRGPTPEGWGSPSEVLRLTED